MIQGMTTDYNDVQPAVRIALMGGAYGNVSALQACLNDARQKGCSFRAFLGDAIGCCGHSDEILNLIRSAVDLVVAGNHEQQAAAGNNGCGCGYSSAEDEQASCQAFTYASRELSENHRRWLATWPYEHRLDTPVGTILLCHGSPRRTNEFLYESNLSDEQLRDMLEAAGARGFICTHSGIPWLRDLGAAGFAANCGVVGKPDNDGDPAVHYLILEVTEDAVTAEIRRVEYDHEGWAAQLRHEGVDEVFLEPLITGIWTVGVISMPPVEHVVQRRPAGGHWRLNWRKAGTTTGPNVLLPILPVENRFDRQLIRTGVGALKPLSVKTVQVNISLKCNLACHHCHVESSPIRTEEMTWETMQWALAAAYKAGAETIDITGGAPEMNPNFRRFVDAALQQGHEVMVRTNLTIMFKEGYMDLPQFYASRGVHIVASLPCYLETNVDRQRGRHVYQESIEIIQRLNALGYGIQENLPLDLVYNPGGPSLPPEQAALEKAYRRELDKHFNIRFTRLYTITNLPIGRFLHDLERQGYAGQYQYLLERTFNPDTLVDLMCRHQLHVGWDGTVYDCDFNYALKLPASSGHIRDFDPADFLTRRIVTGRHCFGCTAGCGSSCGGSLVSDSATVGKNSAVV
ncbi:MAG: arsenosugar biosynthesis radical SAM protein ArsS [Planctomycetia bacterium]|nr:arsenosugar biosynthesis radical SAM protein ArsS [Planctomycetia bacterium]